MRSSSGTLLSLVTIAALGVVSGNTRLGAAQPPPSGGQELPAGFEQILPRGGIKAIDAPQWVAASAAGIPDNAWILGVVIEGQARAFSINLLNFHEVVNDTIGDTAYAAVW